MRLDQNYNTETLPESQGFDPIPEGWYTASISGADLKYTKDGRGQYIAVKYSIIAPEHQGRPIFSNLNIRNNNVTAQEIGLAGLNAIMRAIGLANVNDTDQLIGGTMQIKVKIQPAKDGYEAKNEVNGWKAVEGGTIPKPPTKDTPPWKK